MEEGSNTQRNQTAIEATRDHGKAQNLDSCVNSVHSCAYKCSQKRLVERNHHLEAPEGTICKAGAVEPPIHRLVAVEIALTNTVVSGLLLISVDTT